MSSMTSHISWKHVILICLYSLIFVTGLVTNLALTYLIFTREFMRVKYIFTVSISIAHIVVCLTVVPLNITYIITNDVTLERQCHVIACFTLGMTSYSMLTTAIRRMLALSERYRYANFTYRGKVTNVSFICLFSLAFSIPFMFSQSERRCMYDVISPMAELTPTRNTSFYIDRHTLHLRDNTIGPMSLWTTKEPGDADTTNGHVSYVLLNTSNSSYTSNYDVNSNKTTPILNFHYIENQTYNISNTSGKVYDTVSFPWRYNYTDKSIWIYSVTLFVLQFIGPIIACLIIQTHVYIGIKRRPNQTHWAKELRITQQHIYMVIIVLICWLPVLTLNLVAMNTDGIATNIIHVPEAVCHVIQVLAVSYVLYFPLLYYVLNAHIHREILVWMQGWRQQQQHPEML